MAVLRHFAQKREIWSIWGFALNLRTLRRTTRVWLAQNAGWAAPSRPGYAERGARGLCRTWGGVVPDWGEGLRRNAASYYM